MSTRTQMNAVIVAERYMICLGLIVLLSIIGVLGLFMTLTTIHCWLVEYFVVHVARKKHWHTYCTQQTSMMASYWHAWSSGITQTLLDDSRLYARKDQGNH